MRYFITLLVVLSFAASFGSVELESAQIVDSGHFGITAGGMLSVIGLAGGLASIGAHVGVEYGLSEYLSIGLKGDYFHMPTFDDGSFTQRQPDLSGVVCLPGIHVQYSIRRRKQWSNFGKPWFRH